MNQNLLKGSVYLFLSTIIFITTGYMLNIFLGRYLGPELYGRYGIIIALMSALNLFQTSGLPQALSKYLAEDSTNSNAILKSGLKIQVLLTLILTIIYYFLSAPIANILNDTSLIPYIQLSALILPCYAIFAFYTGYFNGLHQFKKQALINIIYSISKFLAVLIFSLAFKLTGAIIGFVIAPLFTILMKLPIPHTDQKSFSSKKLIIFSIPLLAFVFINNSQQTIDIYFIKSILKSDALVGFYTANQNITKLPFIGLSTIIGIIYPTISRNISLKKHHESRDLIAKTLRVIIMLLIPIVALISATSSEVLLLLYSEAFLPAAPSLSILIIGFAFLTIFTILANILNGSGEPKKSVLLALLGLLTTILLCTLLIPIFNLNGAAMATTGGSLIAMIGALIFVYQKFNVTLNTQSTLKILFSSLTIYFIASLINVPYQILILLYAVLFIIYFMQLIILKEITLDEIKMVQKQFLIRRINKE